MQWWADVADEARIFRNSNWPSFDNSYQIQPSVETLGYTRGCPAGTPAKPGAAAPTEADLGVSAGVLVR
jgi:hypothetical protein